MLSRLRKAAPAKAVAGVQVMLTGLTPSVGRSDVREMFGEIGTVLDTQLHVDGEGRPKGSAEVTLGNMDEAAAAVSAYDSASRAAAPRLTAAHSALYRLLQLPRSTGAPCECLSSVRLRPC